MGFLGNIVKGITNVTSSIGGAFNPISSLVGVGTSLLENSANRKAQEQANQTNMQIAQMNNQYNERMMEKQMAYNTDMWNKENAYNTASSQVQRLKDAGLNPYMALSGSSSAGMATGANGVTPPTAQAANVQAYNSGGQITQALQQGYLADLATQRQKVDINSLQQDMTIKAFEAISKLSNERWDRMTKEQQYKMNKTLLHYADDLNYFELEQRKANLELTKKQTEGVVADNVAKKLVNQRLPEQLANDIALQGADLALKVAQRDLTQEQAQFMFFDTWKTQLQGDKQYLDNKLMRDTWQDLLREARVRSTPSNPWSIAGAGISQAYDAITGR